MDVSEEEEQLNLQELKGTQKEKEEEGRRDG